MPIKQATYWRQRMGTASFLPAINLFLSLFGVYSLLMRHITKSQWLNKNLPREMKNTTIFGVSDTLSRGPLQVGNRAIFRSTFLAEAFIMLIGPVPYWDPVICVTSFNS